MALTLSAALSVAGVRSNGEDSCNNGAPSYYVSGGIVYLNGLLAQAPLGS